MKGVGKLFEQMGYSLEGVQKQSMEAIRDAIDKGLAAIERGDVDEAERYSTKSMQNEHAISSTIHYSGMEAPADWELLKKEACSFYDKITVARKKREGDVIK